MKYNPRIHHRRSTRLGTWDYRDSGAYFVTICAHNRALLFGQFAEDDLILGQFGEIVDRVWRRAVGPADAVGEFVVMPNHVHGIVWIQREPIVRPEPTVGVEQLRVQSAGFEHDSTVGPVPASRLLNPYVAIFP